MSGYPDLTVSETAHALTVIRAGRRARELGVEDPSAPWFVDEAGRRMAAMAESCDRVYEEFNLVRFLLTTRRLRARAPDFSQAVFLGAGFDCRAVCLEVFRSGRTAVFEVDTPAKLARKEQTLREHGVPLPPWVRPVPGDLARDDLPRSLRRAGYDPAVPALVLAEGLFFFLPPELTGKILDPEWLPLAPGSRLIFDFWTDLRVDTLNRRVRESIGIELFHPLPFNPAPVVLEADLRQRGWQAISVQPLDDDSEVADEFPESWFLAEAARGRRKESPGGR